MLTFILPFVFCLSVEAGTWTTGNFSVDLVQDKEEDWVSKNCLESCDLDQLARAYLKENTISAEDLAGGKSPGSVLCQKINAKVLYLEYAKVSDAFCEKDQQVISLARFIRYVLTQKL